MCYALIKQDCKYMYALLLMLFYWNFFGHLFVINFIFISENMTCNSGKGSVVTGNCMTNLESKHIMLCLRNMYCNPENIPKIVE